MRFSSSGLEAFPREAEVLCIKSCDEDRKYSWFFGGALKE